MLRSGGILDYVCENFNVSMSEALYSFKEETMLMWLLQINA